jgi:2-keto-3-deoxy-L-rhamnonate aldolase RhmA
MLNTSLKEKIKHDCPLLGGFVFSSDPNISEIYAESGYDFVIIDTEHALNDVRIVQSHLKACAASGIHAVIRLGQTHYADASRLLDAGAEGLVIPHFAGDETTRSLIQSMKYWPEGQRPTCTGVQIAGYGQRNFAESAAHSNKTVLSIGLIEDRVCVENIDQILNETIVDWIMPGPADLASSYGVHGQLNHRIVQEAIHKTIEAAHKNDIAVGVYVNELSEIDNWAEKKINFFVHAIDYKIIGKALKSAVNEFRVRTQ